MKTGLIKWCSTELEYFWIFNKKGTYIKLTPQTTMKDYKEQIMIGLAFFGVVAPVVIIGYLLKNPTDVTPLTAGFIGVIVGSYTTIFSYYFGSSSGSKSKQELIGKMTAPPTPTDTPKQ